MSRHTSPPLRCDDTEQGHRLIVICHPPAWAKSSNSKCFFFSAALHLQIPGQGRAERFPAAERARSQGGRSHCRDAFSAHPLCRRWFSEGMRAPEHSAIPRVYPSPGAPSPGAPSPHSITYRKAQTSGRPQQHSLSPHCKGIRSRAVSGSKAGHEQAEDLCPPRQGGRDTPPVLGTAWPTLPSPSGSDAPSPLHQCSPAWLHSQRLYCYLKFMCKNNGTIYYTGVLLLFLRVPSEPSNPPKHFADSFLFPRLASLFQYCFIAL